MDITEYMQKAVNAKSQGIPVNWEEVAITAYTAMGQIIADRDKQIADLSSDDAVDISGLANVEGENI